MNNLMEKKVAPAATEANTLNEHANYTPEMLNDVLPMFPDEAAHWLLEFGFIVVPICPAKKHPTVKWQPWVDRLTHDSITKHYGKQLDDVGAIIDHTIMVLDADSEESLSALLDLEKAHDVVPNLIVKTRKGQHHFFKREPGTYAKQCGFSTDKHPTAIDVKTGRSATEGRSIVVLPPSTSKTIVINEAATVDDLTSVGQQFIDAVFKHNGMEAPRPPAPADLTKSKSRAGKHEVREILEYIDPESPNGEGYEGWIKCIIGVKNRCNGDPIGIDLLDDWSSTAPNYCGREVIEYKYDSFDSDMFGGVTFRSVADMAKQMGADLSGISKKYDANGDPIPSVDELLKIAGEMNEDTPESEIQAILAKSAMLKPIAQRRVMDTIKRVTGLTLAVLKEALKVDSPEQEEPDHLSLARKVVAFIGKDNVLGAEQHVWGWNESGVWLVQEERTIRQYVHQVVPEHVSSVTKSQVDGVTDLFKTEIFFPGHEFNIGKDEAVNCRNGEVVFTGGKWTLQQHVREHYRTTQIPISFDPDANAPRFIQFLKEVFKGDVDAEEKTTALLEMIGYTLMAHCRHERFIILVGAGANGKSVLLAVLEALCGSANTVGVQPSQFGNKFQRAHLHMKLANIVTEIEQGEVINDAALKGIVSGEPSTVEHKHKAPFEIRPFSTCWFGTNHMPHTRDFSDALFRRALVMPFNNQFKPELGNCDPRLVEKLKAELPGILNLVLAAYGKALEEGFTMPDSSKKARDEWRLEADQVAQFVDDECIRRPGARTAIGTAFNQYEQWAINNGINKRLGSRSFRDRLTKLGFGNDRSGSARYVTGLTLGLHDFDDTSQSAYAAAKYGE